MIYKREKGKIKKKKTIEPDAENRRNKKEIYWSIKNKMK